MGYYLSVQHVYDPGQVEALVRRLASQFVVEHSLGLGRFQTNSLRLV